ncbi:Selenide, water dikinase [Pelomyxa schiedti]|nr:Selenide, water dikinase [Pelomyxa schiedti]
MPAQSGHFPAAAGMRKEVSTAADQDGADDTYDARDNYWVAEPTSSPSSSTTTTYTTTSTSSSKPSTADNSAQETKANQLGEDETTYTSERQTGNKEQTLPAEHRSILHQPKANFQEDLEDEIREHKEFQELEEELKEQPDEELEEETSIVDSAQGEVYTHSRVSGKDRKPCLQGVRVCPQPKICQGPGFPSSGKNQFTKEKALALFTTEANLKTIQDRRMTQNIANAHGVKLRLDSSFYKQLEGYADSVARVLFDDNSETGLKTVCCHFNVWLCSIKWYLILSEITSGLLYQRGNYNSNTVTALVKCGWILSAEASATNCEVTACCPHSSLETYFDFPLLVVGTSLVTHIDPLTSGVVSFSLAEGSASYCIGCHPTTGRAGWGSLMSTQVSLLCLAVAVRVTNKLYGSTVLLILRYKKLKKRNFKSLKDEGVRYPSQNCINCSVVETFTPGTFLVSTTDFFYPVIDDPYVQGMIGCANVLSDLYSMGITRCDTMLMLLASSEEIPSPAHRRIVTTQMMKGFTDLARKAGTMVTGGQSVRNPWPIIGGVAMSVQPDSGIIRPIHAVAGDIVILTKPLGTQLAVNAHQWMCAQKPNTPGMWDEIKGIITPEEVTRAYNLAAANMSRLNKTGAELMHKYGAHAATDVTGFGILGHSQNLAKEQTTPCSIEIHTLPVIAGMARVNDAYDFGLLVGVSAETSGGLLVCLPSLAAAQAMCSELQAIDGYPAWIVGEVVSSAVPRATIRTNVTIVEVS